MAKECAYCGSAGSFTADHVWPSCFLDRFGRHAAHFSVRGKRVHGGDYVVNDVCEACNSKRLSPLDSYFCRLYDEYFAHLHDFDSAVELHYDFDLLARSLLKIAYNTARQGVSDPGPVAAFRGFVLGQEFRPTQLAVLAELVSPWMVPQADGTICKVMPNMYRSMLGQLLYPGGERILVRIVAVNSFYFHLIVPLTKLAQAEFDSAVIEFAERVKGVMQLFPDLDRVTIHTSPQDGIRSVIPQLRAYREQYLQFFETKGRRGKSRK